MSKEKKGLKAIVAFENYQKKKCEWIQSDSKIKHITVRKCIRPLLRLLLYGQRKICGFQVEVLRYAHVSKDYPVIFAVTHIGKWDFEIVNEQIKDHFYVVASDFLNTYGNIGGWFFNANGVIWVNELSREDKANTKALMTKMLNQGENIMVFPEGTWNLSENEMIRDIAYGTADVAIQTNAVIIPIAVEQYGTRFVINMGTALSPIAHDDKKELTAELRDALAALKWEIWEREGVQSRAELPNAYWEDFIAQRWKEWPQYSMREQIINTFISDKKLEYWQIHKDLRTGLVPKWYELALKEENNNTFA